MYLSAMRDFPSLCIEQISTLLSYKQDFIDLLAEVAIHVSRSM